MTERRDFGLMAKEMREALDQYSREELADLLTHVVRVFVVEGSSPVQVDQEAAAPAGLDELRGLTFAQLVLHLQMNLPHPELGRLHVSGRDVWAEADGREVSLTGGALDDPQEQPPDADIIGAHDAPGVFVQEGPARRPFPTTPEPAAAPEPPTPWDLPPPVSRQEAASIPRPNVALRDPSPQGPAPRLPDAPEEDIGDASDRFSMLELD